MRINKERVVQQFYDLIAIPCPSTQERQVADYLIREMEALGGTVTEDNAAAALQGTTGNLFINFPGTVEGVPKILLSAHLDCVNPCAGIQATLEDGVFRSDGATILGGDDKSGVTAILETLRCLKEQNIPHGPLQVVFTVCEEQGVAGSRNMDASLLDADFGYCLDSSGHPGKIIFAAPGQNKIFTKVHGKTAHGGLAPEKGINAIKKAAEILLDVPTARIDEETTCNIGIIHGGTATNVVPDLVEIAMDCRSRNLEKLEALTERIVAAASGIAPVLFLLPMHFAASIARTCSPITAVIVVSSGMGNVSPFDLVKRTFIPMTGAMIVNVAMTFFYYYRG